METAGQEMPDQMDKSGAGYDGCKIEQDCGGISEKVCNVTKDDLSHRIVRADVEHIDLSVRVEQEVEQRRDQTAGQKHADTLSKAGP